MNDNGYSWPEAMLVLFIIMVIFGTLLPLGSKMTSSLSAKKIGMLASRAAYQGSIQHAAYGLMGGETETDGMRFSWQVEGRSICVEYNGDGAVLCFGE